MRKTAGRMNLRGKKALMRSAKYDAAMAYLEINDKCKRAIGAPDASKQSGGTMAGMSTEKQVTSSRSQKWQYDAASQAIPDEQEIHNGAKMHAAIDYVVCRD